MKSVPDGGQEADDRRMHGYSPTVGGVTSRSARRRWRRDDLRKGFGRRSIRQPAGARAGARPRRRQRAARSRDGGAGRAPARDAGPDAARPGRRHGGAGRPAGRGGRCHRHRPQAEPVQGRGDAAQDRHRVADRRTPRRRQAARPLQALHAEPEREGDASARP